MCPSSPPSIGMLFVALVTFFAGTLAVPLDLPRDLSLDLNSFKNLTATNRCSNSPEWKAHGFLVEDCFPAVQRLYVDEVRRNPDEKYEFSNLGRQRRTGKPWIRTPVQITVSELSPLLHTCALFKIRLVANAKDQKAPVCCPS